MSMANTDLRYPYPDVPEPGELIEVAPGVFWLRMALPMRLDHINLYMIETTDGWWIIDTGIAIDPTDRSTASKSQSGSPAGSAATQATTPVVPKTSNDPGIAPIPRGGAFGGT